MPNTYFRFKQFTVQQDKTAMKVTTDGCLFGAWVAQQITATQHSASTMLDIGTGTGLLSLIVEQQHSLEIQAVEIDKEAAMQAAENIAVSPWNEKIKIIQADIKELPAIHPYDIIISNPPFYENEIKGNNTKRNTAHHNEGLLLHELLPIIRNNLAPGGHFYLLLPAKREEEIKKMMTQMQMKIEMICYVQQTTQHGYFRLMIKGTIDNTMETATATTTLAIKDSHDNYTPEFRQLLAPYYLQL